MQLHSYVCKDCEREYKRSNTIVHRHKSGTCPNCSSKSTKLAEREPHLNFWQKEGRIKNLLAKMRKHDKVCTNFNKVNKEKQDERT